MSNLETSSIACQKSDRENEIVMQLYLYRLENMDNGPKVSNINIKEWMSVDLSTPTQYIKAVTIWYFIVGHIKAYEKVHVLRVPGLMKLFPDISEEEASQITSWKGFLQLAQTWGIDGPTLALAKSLYKWGTGSQVAIELSHKNLTSLAMPPQWNDHPDSIEKALNWIEQTKVGRGDPGEEFNEFPFNFMDSLASNVVSISETSTSEGRLEKFEQSIEKIKSSSSKKKKKDGKNQIDKSLLEIEERRGRPQVNMTPDRTSTPKCFQGDSKMVETVSWTAAYEEPNLQGPRVSDTTNQLKELAKEFAASEDLEHKLALEIVDMNSRIEQSRARVHDLTMKYKNCKEEFYGLEVQIEELVERTQRKAKLLDETVSAKEFAEKQYDELKQQVKSEKERVLRIRESYTSLSEEAQDLEEQVEKATERAAEIEVLARNSIHAKMWDDLKINPTPVVAMMSEKALFRFIVTNEKKKGKGQSVDEMTTDLNNYLLTLIIESEDYNSQLLGGSAEKITIIEAVEEVKKALDFDPEKLTAEVRRTTDMVQMIYDHLKSGAPAKNWTMTRKDISGPMDSDPPKNVELQAPAQRVKIDLKKYSAPRSRVAPKSSEDESDTESKVSKNRPHSKAPSGPVVEGANTNTSTESDDSDVALPELSYSKRNEPVEVKDRGQALVQAILNKMKVAERRDEERFAIQEVSTAERAMSFKEPAATVSQPEPRARFSLREQMEAIRRSAK